jgi:hypothetical protein
MTRAEIAAFFPGKQIHFGCVNYEVPTLDWVQNVAWPAFRDWLFANGLDKWAERFECRDFARMFAAFCVMCWARTKTVASTSDGVSIGEIWFVPDPTDLTSGHAICPLLCDQGLVFIEPQTGAVYPMTQAQINSCYFLRL